MGTVRPSGSFWAASPIRWSVKPRVRCWWFLTVPCVTARRRRRQSRRRVRVETRSDNRRRGSSTAASPLKTWDQRPESTICSGPVITRFTALRFESRSAPNVRAVRSGTWLRDCPPQAPSTARRGALLVAKVVIAAWPEIALHGCGNVRGPSELFPMPSCSADSASSRRHAFSSEPQRRSKAGVLLAWNPGEGGHMTRFERRLDLLPF